MKNEEKEGEKGKEEEKSIYLDWTSAEFTGMQEIAFYRMHNKIPATYSAPTEHERDHN